jgi:hypothetical protein
MEMKKIDFVITWVDGNDPKWLEEFERYSSKNNQIDISKERYRHWDNLHFWFRGVEKFAPWVNKIHFVTWGHVPNWLNTVHPKLNIVKHDDYLDKNNLPVFNSHPIEVNIHKIKGLTEKFVYFNDDMFIINKIPPTYFFKNDLPRDTAASNVISIGEIEHILVNNLRIINKYFIKRDQTKKYIFKWLNLKYGLHVFKTLFLSQWKQYTGFYDPHQAQPYLKSTFEAVWLKEREILEITSQSKYRNMTDVNQYLFRYWQLVTGNFEPIGDQEKKYIDLKSKADCINAAKLIGLSKYNLICLNDKFENSLDFESSSLLINTAFNKILPNKSSYEI